MRSLVRRGRRGSLLGRVVAVTGLLTAGLIGTAPSAHAEDVGDLADLQAAFADPASVGGEATLTRDISAGPTVLALVAGGVLTLDLAGHELAVEQIALGDDSSLTIDDTGDGGRLVASGPSFATGAGIDTTGATLTIDGGTVNATGDYETAGIGGGEGDRGGSVTINGGTVTATGGVWAAGIGGGGDGGDGGSVTINGGTVTATGGKFAAGIGGGYSGVGGSVTIGGGTVVAAGGEEAAGIGGGYFGHGGSVRIEDGAVVTAVNGDGAPTAVGAGLDSGGFGSLHVDGSLKVPAGATLEVPSGDTVPGDGHLIGGGVVTNRGAIQLPTANVDWEALGVDPHNHRVIFDAGAGSPDAEVRVFATSFDAGARALPSDPTRTGHTFQGWNTAPDGSGEEFTTASTVGGDMTVYAQFTSTTTTTVTVDPDVIPVAGRDLPVSATVTNGSDTTPAQEGTVQFHLDGEPVGDPVDLADDATAATTLTGLTAGPHTLSAAYSGGADWEPSTSEETGFEVLTPAEAVDAIDLSAETTDVEEGESLAFTVTGTDANGDSLGDLTDLAELTSSVATDVIDGNIVTFPTASPHTITATVGDATDTLTITVTPTPEDGDAGDAGNDDPVSDASAGGPGDTDTTALPDAGNPMTPTLALALVLLGLGLLGLGVTATRAARTT